MAMPEVGIGFIPDVGGTYPVARTPGLLGTHAALTGAQFGGADAIALGFADHFVPHDKLDAVQRGDRRRRHRRCAGRARRRAATESATGAAGLDRRTATPARPSPTSSPRCAATTRVPAQRRRRPDRAPLPHRGVGHAGSAPPRRQARHLEDVLRQEYRTSSARCARPTSSRASARRSSTRTATRSGRPRRWRPSPPPTSRRTSHRSATSNWPPPDHGEDQ